TIVKRTLLSPGRLAASSASTIGEVAFKSLRPDARIPTQNLKIAAPAQAGAQRLSWINEESICH
ncbi:hypothetical protein ACO0LC_28295, partial [Undibacterium sp. JH2W]|uniref:hypothetical protein n=1 Tax=Undibacterium sp. JH2W TaxID=3413037 RepID=UPI003BF09A45